MPIDLDDDGGRTDIQIIRNHVINNLVLAATFTNCVEAQPLGPGDRLRVAP